MRPIAQFIFLWMALVSMSLTSLAQEYKTQVESVLQSRYPVKQQIDSLYQLSCQHYLQDPYYFRQISDTLLWFAQKTNYTIGKGKSHILLALIAENQGDLETMRQHVRQAMQNIPAEPASDELATAFYCEGNYYRRKKRDKEAIESFIKALAVAEQTGNKQDQASFNTLLGIMHVAGEKYDKALAYYDKALQLAVSINDQVRIQRTFTNKGIVYMRQKQYDKAIQWHQKALSKAKELKEESDEAFAYNDLGATYLESNYDLEKAIAYLKQSIAIRERLKEKDEIVYTYTYLGQAYGKQGNQEEAISWIRKALALSQASGNNKQRYEALDALAQQYHQSGNNDSAYHYLRTYIQFRDSVRKLQQEEAIGELSIRYETEQKEQEIALLTQKNKVQQLGIRQRNLYLFIAVLLVFIAGILLWQFNRTKKIKEAKLKQEAALQAELLQLETQNLLQSDRLRISRDLHDNIGANLIFIQTSVEEVAPDNPILQDIKSLISDTISELRRTVWLINKSAVRIDEWLVKLREYYNKLRKVNILTDVKDEGQVLSARQATLMFRIIQEAVQNSLKHAEPDQVVLRIDANEHTINIRIADNGKGIDPLNTGQGFGMENMRQNAAELNGTFKLDSSAEGTRISVIFPVA